METKEMIKWLRETSEQLATDKEVYVRDKRVIEAIIESLQHYETLLKDKKITKDPASEFYPFTERVPEIKKIRRD